MSTWRRRSAAAAGLAFVVLYSSFQLRLVAQSYELLEFFTIGNFEYNSKEPYEPTPAKVQNGVPKNVLALNGRRVVISGNAMLLDYKDGVTSTFILNANVDLCGFGAVPRINEWILVNMAAGKTAKIRTGDEIDVSGTFQVQEQVEQGKVVGLYSLVADSVR